VDPERERVAVHEAVGDYLSRSARAHKLLFVIEDLHWASIGTRDVVAHIARFGGDAPLMLLITTRDERPFVDDDFSSFLGRLAGLPSVETITLSGLDVTAAANVIAAMGGDLDPDEGVRQTGGNPLYLRELAREGAGSRSLVELVADRFNRLSPSDLDVLDVAAVAGEQIDVPLLASTLDRGNGAVLDALERAEVVGVDRRGRPLGSVRVRSRRVPLGPLRVAHRQPPISAPRGGRGRAERSFRRGTGERRSGPPCMSRRATLRPNPRRRSCPTGRRRGGGGHRPQRSGRALSACARRTRPSPRRR
jgi:hypothetical protein